MLRHYSATVRVRLGCSYEYIEGTADYLSEHRAGSKANARDGMDAIRKRKGRCVEFGHSDPRRNVFNVHRIPDDMQDAWDI